MTAYDANLGAGGAFRQLQYKQRLNFVVVLLLSLSYFCHDDENPQNACGLCSKGKQVAAGFGVCSWSYLGGCRRIFHVFPEVLRSRSSFVTPRQDGNSLKKADLNSPSTQVSAGVCRRKSPRSGGEKDAYTAFQSNVIIDVCSIFLLCR